MLRADTWVVETGAGEISLYGMEHCHLPTQRIRRYALRTDGFVSVRASYAGGEFTTPPLIFSGCELELNYSTSAVGSVQVEVQDCAGHVLCRSDECYGDEIAGSVRWTESALAEWSGRDVRLHFALKDADLYAFKFN